MDDFRERIERGETILFSEILKHIPSDEVLAHLFPDPYSQGQPAITHFGLEVLELRLQGLKQVQIAEKLQTTKSRVAYWSQMTMNSLHKDCLDHVEVDIPALRRLLNLERLPEGRYTKLSELLRDMPSDEELERLDKARGNLGGETKRRHVTQKDLYILRQRLDGRSYDSLCAELGWSRAQVRRNMQGTRMRLIRDLRVELDVPQLFKPYKPSWSLPDPDNYVEAHGKMTSTLGVHIAAYRKEHGETVAQFASRSGVSVSSIRRIESGISDPSADRVWKISRHMGMTMDDLFKKMP